MKGPTVGKHKGRVNSRRRSIGLTDGRIESLIDEYVKMPCEERQILVDQWTTLRASDVPLGVLAEEYGTTRETISKALRDPGGWVTGAARSPVVKANRSRGRGKH